MFYCSGVEERRSCSARNKQRNGLHDLDCSRIEVAGNARRDETGALEICWPDISHFFRRETFMTHFLCYSPGKSGENRVKKFLHFLFLGLLFFVWIPHQGYPYFRQEDERAILPGEIEPPLRISISSRTQWTDTGFDVNEGQVVHFNAKGSISLQKGNPMAYCGPEGYNLQTIQQPLRDRNIGALIGKVVKLISVEIDEETGEEIRNEILKQFYIGADQKVVIPIDGRLFLGINENVVEDNEGEYTVRIYLNENDPLRTPDFFRETFP